MARTTGSSRSSSASSSSHSHKERSRAKAGAMTPEEAGHLGGLKGGKAPHRCRGFQCQEEGSSKSRSR